MPLGEYFRSAPFRIATAYTVLFVASAAILFSVLYWSVTREMTGEIEGAIEQDMRPLVAAYSEDRVRRLVEAVGERAKAARPGESVFLLQTRDGKVLAGNVDPVPPFTGWRELSLERAEQKRDDSDGGDKVLALGVHLENAFLLVGRNSHRIEETQELLVRSLAWTLGVMIALALAGGVALSRGALRRIEEINRTTRAIIDGHLSQRIPVRDSRDEINRLARNINHMLDRIEELMQGLRQVTNDIAHDLRTPLGRLRQKLESAHRRETTSEGHKAALERAIEETNAILDTFNALLRIAQIEAGARRSHFAQVSLSEVATAVAEAYETVAEDEGDSFSARIDPGVCTRGDRDLLTQMLANLVENAICHSPAGAKISVTLSRDDGGPALTVTDTGPGIPPEERDRVLDRFYRLEKSRTTPGSGLGLALVKAIADLHGASLELSDNEPGLRVELRFPARIDH